MNTTNASATPFQPLSDSFQPAHIIGDIPHPEPAIIGNGFGEPPKPQKILDEKLEETDIRIVISLDLHGRTTKIASLRLDRVVSEGADLTNRAILLKTLKSTVAEIRRVAAYKLNKKLPIPANLGNERDDAASTDVGEQPRPDFVIHHPPPLDS